MRTRIRKVSLAIFISTLLGDTIANTVARDGGTSSDEVDISVDKKKPLVISCEDALALTGENHHVCSFQISEGKETFKVCTERQNGQLSKCWKIDLNVELEPAADETKVNGQGQGQTQGQDGDAAGHSIIQDSAHDSQDEQAGQNEPAKDKPTLQRVQIGTYIFDPPFDGFGKSIQRLLENPQYGSSFEEAEWLYSVGEAFQKRALLYMGINSKPQNEVEKLFKRAASAFEGALFRYRQLLANHQADMAINSVITMRLQLMEAKISIKLAENFQLSQAKSSRSNVIQKYLLRAESTLKRLYDTVVSTQKGSPEFGAELIAAYAEVSLRLGVGLSQGNDGESSVALSNGVAAAAETWLVNQVEEDFESFLIDTERVDKMIQSFIPPLVAKSHRVLVLFLRSKILWERLLLEKDSVKALLSKEDILTGLCHLSSVAQNIGTTWLGLEQYERAATALEEAGRIQREIVLPKLPISYEVERNAIIVGAGENLYSLADVYLRMGDYEKALDRYQSAMAWYLAHRVPPPSAISTDDITEKEEHLAAIQTYEQALEEYSDMFVEGLDSSDPAANDANGFYSQGGAEFGEYSFEKRDNGYEGDLHNNLGAFYMSIGDFEQAAIHLNQALWLYLANEEGQDATTATTYTQLAMLHFHQGDFRSSMANYEKALEIFQKIVPPGQNPLYHGGQSIVQWPEVIAKALEQLPDIGAEMPEGLDVEQLTVAKDEESPEITDTSFDSPPPEYILVDVEAFSRAQVNESDWEEQ